MRSRVFASVAVAQRSIALLLVAAVAAAAAASGATRRQSAACTDADTNCSQFQPGEDSGRCGQLPCKTRSTTGAGCSLESARRSPLRARRSRKRRTALVCSAPWMCKERARIPFFAENFPCVSSWSPLQGVRRAREVFAPACQPVAKISRVCRTPLRLASRGPDAGDEVQADGRRPTAAAWTVSAICVVNSSFVS